MDSQKVAAFMQTLRKEKGMTQKELADKICVSDKTISKWENGNSMPDTTILVDLCRELDVSVNELLNAERIPPDEYSKKAEVTIMSLFEENQEHKKGRYMQYALGCLFLVLTIVLIQIGGGMDLTWYLDIVSLILLMCGCITVVLLSGKRKKKDILCILRKTVFPIGIVIALVSTIAVIGNIGDPQTLGPNFAVILLSLLYATIFYIIF